MIAVDCEKGETARQLSALSFLAIESSKTFDLGRRKECAKEVRHYITLGNTHNWPKMSKTNLEKKKRDKLAYSDLNKDFIMTSVVSVSRGCK